MAIFLHIFSLSSFARVLDDVCLNLTKYGWVKKTESIVLAEVISKAGDDVEFKILEVLKGDFKDKVFHVREVQNLWADLRFDIYFESHLPPLLAEKIRRIKPKYLLFLNKSKDGWEMSYEATSAMNSRIMDTNSSPLIKTVEQFIRIGSTNNYEIETNALKRLRRVALSGPKATEFSKYLVSEIDDELDSPTPDKPYDYLVKMYARSSKEKKIDVLWAFAWGKHQEAVAFFMNLFEKPIPLNYLGPISEYITQTRNEALLVRVGRNYPNLDRSARWPLADAMIKTADRRNMDLMLAALEIGGRRRGRQTFEVVLAVPE